MVDQTEDEEIVLIHEARIDGPAFKIGETLGDQRRCDAISWHRRRQSEVLSSS
jgi:hypothetical protein